MASWVLLEEQTVWVSARAVAFTVVCDQCAQAGEARPSVEGRLELDRLRSTLECPNGHRLRVERDGR